MMSSSARKRAGGEWPEETFSNPQFEKGRKFVPEAELEHVSPSTTVSETEKNDEETVDVLRNRIQENLVKIEEYLSRINELTKDVEQQEASIKKLLQEN